MSVINIRNRVLRRTVLVLLLPFFAPIALVYELGCAVETCCTTMALLVRDFWV